jgi:hypothetical protein
LDGDAQRFDAISLRPVFLQLRVHTLDDADQLDLRAVQCRFAGGESGESTELHAVAVRFRQLRLVRDDAAHCREVLLRRVTVQDLQLAAAAVEHAGVAADAVRHDGVD